MKDKRLSRKLPLGLFSLALLFPLLFSSCLETNKPKDNPTDGGDASFTVSTLEGTVWIDNSLSSITTTTPIGLSEVVLVIKSGKICYGDGSTIYMGEKYNKTTLLAFSCPSVALKPYTETSPTTFDRLTSHFTLVEGSPNLITQGSLSFRKLS